MISMDDALITRTQEVGPFGYVPIVQAVENTVAHFIWKDKPVWLSGNVYAHEVGILSEADESTGVSFSSSATAFHLGGWTGIFILAPIIWFALFTILTRSVGTCAQRPWGFL
jgi:hypothetical protein